MAAVVEIPLNQLPAEIGRAIASMGRVQFEPVGKVLEQMAKSDVKRNFDQSRSPDGVPWAPLRYPRVNSKGGDKPLQNFGFFYGSIQARATRTDLTLSSNLAYAGLHQFGGIVRPRKGKFLAIPATKEASRSPARRFPRRLHCIVGKVGGVLLDDNDVVQYYLSKQVKVPARPFLGFSRELIDDVAGLLTDVALNQFTLGQRPGAATLPMTTRARRRAA